MGNALGEPFYIVDLDTIDHIEKSKRINDLRIYLQRDEFIAKILENTKLDKINTVDIVTPDYAEDLRYVQVQLNFIDNNNAFDEVSLYVEYISSQYQKNEPRRRQRVEGYQYERLFKIKINNKITSFSTRVSLVKPIFRASVKLFAILRNSKNNKTYISTDRTVKYFTCGTGTIAVRTQEEANKLNREACESMPLKHKGMGEACREYKKYKNNK